jgi:hypothetical protein
MTKYGKEIVLSLAPYKTIKLAVTEAASFEECDKKLKAELEKMPEIAKLNEAEIKKVLK